MSREFSSSLTPSFCQRYQAQMDVRPGHGAGRGLKLGVGELFPAKRA